jgi:hypothetical protein
MSNTGSTFILHTILTCHRPWAYLRYVNNAQYSVMVFRPIREHRLNAAVSLAKPLSGSPEVVCPGGLGAPIGLGRLDPERILMLEVPCASSD